MCKAMDCFSGKAESEDLNEVLHPASCRTIRLRKDGFLNLH